MNHYEISKTNSCQRLNINASLLNINAPLLYSMQPIRAGETTTSTHHFTLSALNRLGKNKAKSPLPSPFDSRFVQNKAKAWINQFKVIKSCHADYVHKISNLDRLKNPTNPFRDFIKSLSKKPKNPENPIPENPIIDKIENKEVLNDQFASEILGIVNENSVFITLRLARPKNWRFEPGQYLEIRAEESSKPAILAIASGIGEDYIEITAKVNANPAHPNYCLNRPIGEKLLITGPLGSHFPVSLISTDTPVLLLGGGSGLTALRSLMQSLPPQTEARLIYSSKTAEGLFYQEEIEQWKSEGHVISLTQGQDDRFAEGRIDDHLKNYDFKPNTLIFICGPKELVLEIANKLVDCHGVSRECIYGSLPNMANEGGPVYRADHPKMMMA